MILVKNFKVCFHLVSKKIRPEIIINDVLDKKRRLSRL